MSIKGKHRNQARVCGQIFACHDCDAVLAVRSGFLGGGWDHEWFMVKNTVWHHGQLKGECRFLCVTCLEHRIDRKLSAADFRRSPKVNVIGKKSARLRYRMRGLQPAKRLVETRFTP